MLAKKGQNIGFAIYTIRVTYIYQVVVHVHQDCYTYIKGHIYMLNDATLTSRLSDIFTSRFFSNIYIKFSGKYTS